MELCGGTHVRSGGEVGSICLVSESGISAGTRRLEAVAGLAAYEWAEARLDNYSQLLKTLACQPNELLERIEQMQANSKQLEKKLRSIDQRNQAGIADQVIDSAKQIGEIKIMLRSIPGLSPNDLRGLAAQINKRSEPSVVLLASEKDDKCSMVCICSQAAIEVGHQAGTLLSELAQKMGGKGGGKPDFAMGGASAGKGVDDALAGHSLHLLQ